MAFDERFPTRLESRPHERPSGPQGKCGSKPSTVGNASRRQYRRRMYQVDYRRHERQGSSRPTVAARFRALGDDHISSHIKCLDGFAHVHDLDDQPGLRFANGPGQGGRIPEREHHRAGSVFQCSLHRGEIRRPTLKADAPGLARTGSDQCDFTVHPPSVAAAYPYETETARVGHRGSKDASRRPPHRGQHNRVLDLQHRRDG